METQISKRFGKSEKTVQSDNKAWLCIWNVFLLLAAPAVICTASLILAIGMYPVSYFINYFKNPIIFLLNYIPIFLTELLLYCLIGKHWLSYLITSLVYILASAGDMYKLKFRYEPFLFSDMDMVMAGVKIAKEYDMTPNTRLIIAALAVIVGSVFLFFFAKGRVGKAWRISGAALSLISAALLLRPVYFNEQIYNVKASPRIDDIIMLDAQETAARGFVYPFIYSIGSSMYTNTAPDNYREENAAAVLQAYTPDDIPTDRRVNVVFFQLESFRDLTADGFGGIAPEVYDRYHEIESESYHGRLITNVFGGSTIVTEHSVMTGDIDFRSPKADCPSYIRWFAEQGYKTTGIHPYPETFYNRVNVNKRLGFSEYLFLDAFPDTIVDTDNAIFSDKVVMDTVYHQLEESIAKGENLLSFNVTLQGHGSYPQEYNLFGVEYWKAPDGSESAENIVNSYLGSVADTVQNLSILMERTEKLDAPVVIICYGDHKPVLDNGENLFESMGISFDTTTETGFINQYATEYLIWANSAAKSVIGDISGQGPDISPCYLMNLTFEKLGFKGDSFAQYMTDMMHSLPVVTTRSAYVENGKFTFSLSNDAAAQLDEMMCVQYYYRDTFKNK